VPRKTLLLKFLPHGYYAYRIIEIGVTEYPKKQQIKKLIWGKAVPIKKLG